MQISLLIVSVPIIGTILFFALQAGLAAAQSMKARRPIPLRACLGLMMGFCLLALASWVTVVLTIGLAHSRSPIQYTMHYGIGIAVLFLALPITCLVTYQWNANSRSKK